MRDTVLFQSSFSPQYDDFFEGFAFVGSDYIYGHEGRLLFGATTGRTIPPGEDGCYVVGQRTSHGYEIGTDAAGLSKLFVYRHANEWAVSSSYSGLVSMIRAHGRPLTLQPRRLRPLAVNNAFSLQLATFQTPFNEIRLVPKGRIVRLVDGQLTVIAPVKEPALDYSEALAQFISIWRARLQTLLSDPKVTMSADLSGGNDSRVVLAFLLESGKFDTQDPRFTLYSNPAQLDDFQVASALAEKYGLKLNGQATATQRHTTTSHVMFQHWREHSLGVYTPVYVEQAFRGPLELHAHGAGGGNIRPVFGDESLESKANNYVGKIPREAATLWRNDLALTQKQLSRSSPGVPPLIQHYIEFRGRFHFGHIPQARPMFMPLMSKLVGTAVNKLAEDHRQQFYFDVMESLVPGLMNVRYDAPSKAPSAQSVESLTVVPLEQSAQAGRVFAFDGSPPQSSMQIDVDGDSALELWSASVQEALRNSVVGEFIGDATLNDARQALEQVQSGGKPPASHSAQAILLSYCLAVDFAFANSTKVLD